MPTPSIVKPSALFRYYKGLPYQAAAISELEELLLVRCPDLFTRDQPWFKTWSQSGKQLSSEATAPPKQQSGASLPLKVPYYSQRDSRVPGQAPRSCFSSSCAMLLAYLKPGVLTGPNADDTYLRRVLTFGDTTDASAQIKALASYGVTATLKQNCDWLDLHNQLGKGIPVPCGFLHHGTPSNPTGGGHWLIVTGIDAQNNVTVNDPWGEMAVAAGTYLNPNGAGLTYSSKNWGPRWLAEGPHSGWAIIAKAPA